VVSTENKEVLWVFYLVGKQEADGLQGLLSAIDIIPESCEEGRETREAGTHPRKR
jgi:hypothetical protein